MSISRLIKTDKVFGKLNYFNFSCCFFLLLIIIALAGCSKKKNDEPVSNFTEIFPLKFGNYWTWFYTFYPDSYHIDTIEYIVTGSRNIMFNGNEIFVYEIQAIFNGKIDSTRLYMKNQSDGLWSYGTSGTGSSTPYLSVKYPVNVGDSWPDPEGGGNMICSSVNEQFNIGIGSFNCIEYQTQYTIKFYSSIKGFNMLFLEKEFPLNKSSTYKYKLYYKPGLGNLGQIALKDDVIWYKAELVSYKIN